MNSEGNFSRVLRGLIQLQIGLMPFFGGGGGAGHVLAFNLNKCAVSQSVRCAQEVHFQGERHQNHFCFVRVAANVSKSKLNES